VLDGSSAMWRTLMMTSGGPPKPNGLRSDPLRSLEKIYPPEDPVLLRPLYVIASGRFEQSKTAKAR
jgi:hypothetical protein